MVDAFVILYHDGEDWTRVRGPRGDRWLRTAWIARYGIVHAYAVRWTRVTKVGGRWATVAGGA